ncbi:MAG: branched-chain-amino-acid transaminase [Clostridia bacterium]|nr:branched-chain-amino-acid transaminase [Clostridia bacterium]
MGQVIYLDGQFVPVEQAKVSVYDHGFLYGDGIFEGIRMYGGRVFKLEEHIRRLYHSARVIDLEIPLPPDEMSRVVLETCRRNELDDGYIRLVVSRGAGDLGLDPRKCPRPTVVVIVDRIALFPESLLEQGLTAVTAATRRTSVDALDARVKSLNYLNSIMAKLEANLAGAHEILMLNREGYVCEGTGDNVFIVRGGTVLTPPAYLGILEGITRATVLDLARELGIEAREAVFTRYDVYTADECFLTGTAAEVVPVTTVDGRPVGDGRPGPVTRRLRDAYFEFARSHGTSFRD